MGFYGQATILNHDVSIVDRCIVSWKEKIKDASEYSSEVYKPTKMICDFFKDKIKYSIPVADFWVIDNSSVSMKLEVFRYFPNKVILNGYESVLEYLSDENKIIYLCKVDNYIGSIFNLYCYEIDNLPNLRNKKIENILI